MSVNVVTNDDADVDAVAEAVRAAALAAREASRDLSGLTRSQKDAVLLAMAADLLAATDVIVAANDEDVARAEAAGTSASMIDRLRLTPERVAGIAGGLRQVASLPDPVGEIVRGSRLGNGLLTRQVRVPLGVVGMIYEARPNVTVDAAGLCLKSGNAALLRGSSSAIASNTALVKVMQGTLVAAGLPAAAISLVPGEGHEPVKHLMRSRGLVDVIIPRGGAGLIRAVVEESVVPVLETGVGNCHVYVDADADLQQALAIVMNSKTHRPSVCNAAESLLVHQSVADAFLPVVIAALVEAGVTIHGDASVAAVGTAVGLDVVPVTDEDFATEYVSLDISAAVVPDLDFALAHIRRYGTGHTEAIVSRSSAAQRAFIAGVDAAAIMVNASTRFTDGEQLGMGAEIGISTQKLHARGPMALPELTTTTWIIEGDGHIRA